jgi:Na+/H+ antiporter NhaD/arsenite permease-like protein
MSNVPAALFLSEFTNQWKALLWGVNVGGFGTLIASMANLIAYKIYLSRRKNQKGFLWKFHLVSFLFLAVGIITYLLVEKLL